MDSAFILEHDVEISPNRGMNYELFSNMRFYLQKPENARRLM